MLLLKFNVCKAMRFTFFAQKMFVLVHDNEPRIMQKVTQKRFVKRKWEFDMKFTAFIKSMHPYGVLIIHYIFIDMTCKIIFQ